MRRIWEKHRTLVVLSGLGALVLTLFILDARSSKNDLQIVNITASELASQRADQVNNAITQTLVDFTPDKTSSDLAIEVVSATEFYRILDSTSTFSAAAINPYAYATAVLQQEKRGKSRILAAYVLPEDLKALAARYEAKGLDVQITAPPSVRTTTPTFSPYGSIYSNMANNGAAPTTTSHGNTSFFGRYWPFFFLAGLVFWWRRRAKGDSLKLGAGARGGSGIYTANGKIDDASVPQVRFTDIAGCNEAIEDMQELVEFLKNPERFTRTGANPPKGALLIGPPGTGKTLLAKAVAGEAGVPFYSVAASDFVEIYVGVGAKRVRELFKKARDHEDGAIVFIDEVDAIGKKRSSGMNNNSEQENTLNAMLVEMDGFSSSKVIVLAATNRDDVLDPALVRPGRLDRKIHVPLPDRSGRERIIRVHARNKPLATDVDFTLIARRTPGMSGAELAQVVNEAALVAARADAETITAAHFDAAIATVTMGKARTSAVISDEDKLLTAWHESGHAVCGLVQQDALNPVSISIVPRGVAGGVTHFPARDSGYITRKQAYSQLVTAMGGMAAEQILLGDGEFTTGPSGDLQAGTNLALAMVTHYGMGERLLVKSEQLLYSSGVATDEVVAEADGLLRRALDDAKDLLRANESLVRHMVEALLEWETLTNSQIEELMKGRRTVDAGSPPPAPRGNIAEPAADIPASQPSKSAPAHEPIPALARIAAAVYRGVINRRRRRRRGVAGW